MENPFLYIVPRRKEEIVANQRIFNRLLKEARKPGNIILLIGEEGSGRTLFAKKLEEELKASYFPFSQDIGDRIEQMEARRGKIIIIDDFDMAEQMGKDAMKKLIKKVLERAALDMTFVLTLLSGKEKELLKLEPKLKKAKRIEIPPLSLEGAKELVLSRLNEVRKKKSSLLEPFAEEEVRHIWKRSRGNPRMILLICSSLFDARK